MIISRTPYRVSFFGGGTDYPQWYNKEGGAVLSTAIDKYCFICCRYLPPFFEHKYRVVWSHIETVSTISEILHPAVREGLKYLDINGQFGGLEISHQGDLPARTGMGSSSAFVVGLFKVLTALKGRIVGARELSEMAIEFEQKVLRENVGSQDQVAAAYGGFNKITFSPNDKIKVEPVTISADRIRELESHLLLIYTGTTRLSSEISGEFVGNLSQRRETLRKMRNMVDEALDILSSGEDIHSFGLLLDEAWKLKKGCGSRISNSVVDRLYEQALQNGAVGGKLLGAGGGGFMLFFVPPLDRQKLLHALSGYLHVPFRFESEGSKIIYYSSETGRTYS